MTSLTLPSSLSSRLRISTAWLSVGSQGGKGTFAYFRKELKIAQAGPSVTSAVAFVTAQNADPLLNGYFGQMYSLGMQNGSDPRFLQGIATLKHFDANQLEGDWPGPESVCTVRPDL